MRLVFRAISVLLCSVVLIGTPDDQKKLNVQVFDLLCKQRAAANAIMDFSTWSCRRSSIFQKSIRRYRDLTKAEMEKKIMQAQQDITHMKLPTKTNKKEQNV